MRITSAGKSLTKFAGETYSFNFYGITDQDEYFLKNVKTYTANGETMYDISKKFGVDLDTLALLNGEDCFKYRHFGTEIKLPK